MPLIVTKDSAYTTYILPDFKNIVDTDFGSLGDTNIPGTDEVQITYYSKVAGFAQGQFFAICHETSGVNIYLKYVQSSFQLPETPPVAIATVQGATYPPGTGDNPDVSGVVEVFLDAYNDNGSNYWVQGADGSKIFSPRWVQLFHELSHALHAARGQVTASTPDAVEDQLTIGDENKLRAQYQPQHSWLKQRALVELGGTGMADPDPKFNNPQPKSGCFVVTASYGSDSEGRVQRLREVRDRFLGSSPLSVVLTHEAYREYYRYSQQIAAAMLVYPTLRSAIRAYFVEPMLAFCELLEAHLRFSDESLRTALERTQRRIPVVDLELMAAVTRELELGRRQLDANWKIHFVTPAPPLGGGVAPVTRYVIGVIRAQVNSAPYTEWGLLRPLQMYWRAMQSLAAGETILQVTQKLEHRLDAWLGEVPLHDITRHLTASRWQEDLDLLLTSLRLGSAARSRVASRLAEHRGNTSPQKEQS